MGKISRCERVFNDEKTGRTIRQLTDFEFGAHANYFRLPRYLPDGRTLAWRYGENHSRMQALLIDIDRGDIQPLPDIPGQLRLREHDGRIWFLKGEKPDFVSVHRETKPNIRTLWQADLPDGSPELLCRIPEEVPGSIVDITCDGAHVILADNRQDMTPFSKKQIGSPEVLDRYLRRPRSATLYCYSVSNGSFWPIHSLETTCFGHVDASPCDPGLVRFSQDVMETHGQRIWSVRIDGSELRPIRPQAFGEVVTHEFWWGDPSLIGYTYQDRRGDPTIEYQHCSEYCSAATRLGIASLSGEEVYLSNPLNSYHTHILCARDGRQICGEGTDGNSMVFAARFDLGNPQVDLVPFATIHTPYVPFRGQFVESAFSSDGRWLMYADILPGQEHRQLFAVKVDY